MIRSSYNFLFGYYNLPSAFEEFHDLRDKQYEIVSVKKRLLCYIFNTENSKKSQQRQRPCCNPVPTFHLYYVKIITQPQKKGKEKRFVKIAKLLTLKLSHMSEGPVSL